MDGGTYVLTPPQQKLRYCANKERARLNFVKSKWDKTVIDWNNYMRELCVLDMENKPKKKVGGQMCSCGGVNTTTVTMPQLHVIEKLRQIPLVEIAYNTSAGVYKRVKDCNGLVHWTLNGAEGAFQIALGAVTPVAVKLQQPINLVDDTLCKGIDVLQEKVPIVKEPPSQIYESAKSYVSNSAAAGKVQSITTKSWEKANEVLSTSYGNMALNGLDTTSNIADKYIDYYLPAEEDEENIHPHPNTECEDKVLHTVHTVSTLSAKVSRRVYRTLSGSRKRPQLKDGETGTSNTQMDNIVSHNTEHLKQRTSSSGSDEHS